MKLCIKGVCNNNNPLKLFEMLSFFLNFCKMHFVAICTKKKTKNFPFSTVSSIFFMFCFYSSVTNFSNSIQCFSTKLWQNKNKNTKKMSTEKLPRIHVYTHSHKYTHSKACSWVEETKNSQI